MSQCQKRRVANRTAIIGIAVAALLTFGTCRKGSSRVGAASACIADSIGTLHLVLSARCANEELLCRAKCTFGSSASCLGLAYEAEKDPTKGDQAVRFYRRACLFGAANACTNYAAGIWARTHSDNELICARRLFEKACAVKEPFACGMVGRLMLEDATPGALLGGRKYLESACTEVGGFSCRVLAMKLESGILGTYEPGKIRALLKRACETGDLDACGEPATAAETFH